MVHAPTVRVESVVLRLFACVAVHFVRDAGKSLFSFLSFTHVQGMVCNAYGCVNASVTRNGV